MNDAAVLEICEQTIVNGYTNKIDLGDICLQWNHIFTINFTPAVTQLLKNEIIRK